MEGFTISSGDLRVAVAPQTVTVIVLPSQVLTTNPAQRRALIQALLAAEQQDPGTDGVMSPLDMLDGLRMLMQFADPSVKYPKTNKSLAEIIQQVLAAFALPADAETTAGYDVPMPPAKTVNEQRETLGLPPLSLPAAMQMLGTPVAAAALSGAGAPLLVDEPSEMRFHFWLDLCARRKILGLRVFTSDIPYLHVEYDGATETYRYVNSLDVPTRPLSDERREVLLSAMGDTVGTSSIR